jgi:hypothetical protein
MRSPQLVLGRTAECWYVLIRDTNTVMPSRQDTTMAISSVVQPSTSLSSCSIASGCLNSCWVISCVRPRQRLV